MGKCSGYVAVFVILFAATAASTKEECDECWPAEECQMYQKFKPEQQRAWLERFRCRDTQTNQPQIKTIVCCPENIWGVTNDVTVPKNTGTPEVAVKTQLTDDSNNIFEHDLDVFSDEDKSAPKINNGQRGSQNPYFQPALQSTSLGAQCPPTSYPPDIDSGCCGLEASDSFKQNPPRRIERQRPSRTNNQFNWMPEVPRSTMSSYWPAWMRFNEEDNTKAERTRRQVDDTPTVTVDSRIAGGKETDLKQFPWTTLLKVTFKYPNKESTFSCGGSLISSKYVLSAGHCVYDPEGSVKSVEVTLAEYDKRTFPRDCKFSLSQGEVCIDNVVMYAEHFIIHPEYNDEKLLNDVCLLRLRGNAPYTDYIRPICLPAVDVDTPDLSNLKLTAVGWGRNGVYKSDVKQSTTVNLVAQSVCKKSYPGLTRRQMCAVGYSGEDTCKGDSGGPLMVTYRGKYMVSGIVSGKRSDAPCGTSVPSLYSNVYQYVPWIRSVIYKQQA